MANIKKKDLEILIEVEDFLYKNINTNNKKQSELFTQYWNLVERICQTKDLEKKKSRDFNKTNKEYHNLSNCLYQARKNNNKQKIKEYEEKIKEYKKRKMLKNAIKECV